MTHAPQRWLDDPASVERGFVDAAASFRADAPNARQMERMLHNLGALAGHASIDEPGLVRGAGPSVVRSTLIRWLGFSTMAAIVAGASLWALPSTTEPHPEPKVAPAPALAPAPPPSRTPSPAREEPPASAPTKARPRSKPIAQVAPAAPPDLVTESSSDPAAELAMLQRARRVVRAAPERALAIAEAHRAQHPRGVFAEERELLAIEALLATGASRDAAHRAELFRAAFPRSFHAQRLSSLLERAQNPEEVAPSAHPSSHKEHAEQP